MDYIANITIVTGVTGNQREIAPGSKVTGLDADEIERLIAMGAVRPAEPQAAPAEPQDEQAKAARRKRQP